MSQFDSIRFQPSRPLLKEVSADRLNAILSEIKKNRPRGERGITVRHSGDGTYIGLAASIKSATRPTRLPWDIYTEGQGDGSYTLKVSPGTVGGFLPTNWDDEFTAQEDQLVYGKVVVATDGFNITGATIVIDDQPPAAQSPQVYETPDEAEVLFGMFKDGTIRVATQGNISFGPRVYMTKEKSAAPGESPYDIYYWLAQ